MCGAGKERMGGGGGDGWIVGGMGNREGEWGDGGKGGLGIGGKGIGGKGERGREGMLEANDFVTTVGSRVYLALICELSTIRMRRLRGIQFGSPKEKDL